MSEQEPKDKKTFTEEIEIAGNQLVDRVKELVEEGNVRLLRVKSVDDNVYMEMPLTIGVLAGGALALAATPLALLAVFAAVVARVKIEVVREVTEDDFGKDQDGLIGFFASPEKRLPPLDSRFSLGLARLRHHDDHIALFVSGFDVAMRFDNLLQRIAAVDNRSELSRFHQFLE